MKKIALLLVVVLIVASMSVLLFACTTKVAGKTYVLDSVEVTGDGATEAQIAYVKGQVEESYKNAELVFNKDGTMVVTVSGTEMMKNYYKQDGKNIFVDETEDVKTEDVDPTFVVDGKKLVWTYKISSITVNMTLKLK